MRFFATFSLFATLACSTFTSAIPTPAPVPALNGGYKIDSREPLEVRVVERAHKSVPQILADVTSKLQQPLDQLSGLKANTAKASTITPILFDVNNVLVTALDEVKLLLGAPLDAILLSVDGTVVLEVAEVAQLVANVVILVVNVLFGVLGTVGFDLAILGSELPIVGLTLADIVSELTGLIGGLLAELTPLVGSLLLAVDDLVFTTLVGVLGLA